MIGTLSSAFLLPWSGQIIDRVDLRYFVTAVMLGLTLACVSMSFADSAVFVAVAIFLLRQFGQGLSSHTGTTSMARYYGPNRGKAIALASIGFSLGESLLPVGAVLMIAILGWRSTYLLAAGVVLLLIFPALWLLRGHGTRHVQHLAELENGRDHASGSYTRRQVLGETRFYLLLPALLAPSFILTAMFFHHLTLAEYKHWSAEWVTGSYWVYALATIATMLVSGPIIDRITAKRIMPLFLLPLVAAMLIVGPAQSDIWLLPYLLLLGVNTGFYFTGFNAMWAELYGAKFLGAIKSLMTSLGVLASALGPVTVGLMLDAGSTMQAVCLWFAAGGLVATLLLIRALTKN